ATGAVEPAGAMAAAQPRRAHEAVGKPALGRRVVLGDQYAGHPPRLRHLRHVWRLARWRTGRARERREGERREDGEGRSGGAPVRNGRRSFHVLNTMSATAVETAARRLKGERPSRARAVV